LGAWRVRFFGLFVLVLVLAGCGGSGYTKSDFIARADAICAGAVRQTRSIAPPGAAQAGSGQDGALAAYLSNVVPVLENEASQLRALRRPPGNAGELATLNRWYSALAQSVMHYKELAAAARRGDDQSVADAEAALGASPVYSLAASYGLRSCGTPGATVA
jgi:hypothetical protein